MVFKIEEPSGRGLLSVITNNLTLCWTYEGGYPIVLLTFIRTLLQMEGSYITTNDIPCRYVDKSFRYCAVSESTLQRILFFPLFFWFWKIYFFLPSRFIQFTSTGLSIPFIVCFFKHGSTSDVPPQLQSF